MFARWGVYDADLAQPSHNGRHMMDDDTDRDMFDVCNVQLVDRAPTSIGLA